MNDIIIIIKIGVKSKGPKVVGRVFLTFKYIGSIISAMNLGLILNHNKFIHDKITSNITIYDIISNKIINAKSIVIIIFLYY